jgi:hypothetical protein
MKTKTFALPLVGLIIITAAYFLGKKIGSATKSNQFHALEYDRLLHLHHEQSYYLGLELNRIFLKQSEGKLNVKNFDYTATRGRQGESDDGSLIPWPWSLEARYKTDAQSQGWNLADNGGLHELEKNNLNIQLKITETVEQTDAATRTYIYKLIWQMDKEAYLQGIHLIKSAH